VTRPRAIAKLIMMTSIAATGSRQQAAGTDWSGTLDAALNAAYVTNPQWIVGSHVSDEAAQLTVDGKTTAQTELGQFTLTPRLSSVRYWHETELNFDTGSIDATYLRKLERGQWNFEGLALTDSTVVSELGTTGLTETNRRHYANSLSLGYTYFISERLSWLLQGAWQDTRYTDAQQFGLTNYTYASASMSPSWAFSSRLNGSLILATDRITPEVGFRQDDYSASLQLSRNVTERYAWHVSAGATHVDAGNVGGSTSTVFEVGVSRQTERVRWDLSVKRAVLPIGLGYLAPQTSGNLTLVVATTERSSLNLVATGLRTDAVTFGNQILYSGTSWIQGSAEWRYNLSPNWTVAGAYQQGRTRNLEESVWANGSQARITVTWQSGRL